MGHGGRILVVDDDPGILHLVSLRLASAGYQVGTADSGENALLRFHESPPQLVITDLRMGGMDGLTLLDHLQAAAPGVPVIMLTAHGSIPDAISATQRGVFGFLTKPFDGQELLQRVAEAIRLSPLLNHEHVSAEWRREVVSVSLLMEEALRQALRVSLESKPALLVGPGGAGKATLARAIHRAGARAAAPLIRLVAADCPAAEQEVLLSLSDPRSLWAGAAGGLLYLEEVGVLSLAAQARLFAVLMAQMQASDPLFRLGQPSSPETVANVQVIASTSRSLDAAVMDGRFRRDLYYLLGKVSLQVPSLAERPEDIPVLSRHFLASIRPEIGLSLAPGALLALQEARWPDNVRQLRSVLEQAAESCLTPVLTEAAVRRVIRQYEAESLAGFDDARRDFEREYLTRLLQTTAGNVSHAARVARRNRTEFYKLLARHGLDPVDFK
ncbi:MAG: response regulator [Azonexus sp.]